MCSLFCFVQQDGGFSGEHDLELWTWEKVKIGFEHLGLPGEHHLYFENVNRFNDDIGQMFQTHQMLGVELDLPGLEGWSIMPSYKYIDNQSPSADENRYIVDLLYKEERIFDSKIEYKFRFRWDIRNVNQKNEITYRLRPSFTLNYPLPFEIDGRPIKTFLENEINFDTNVNQLNRHRLSTGLTFPFTSTMSWTLGYLLESNRIRSGKWDSDSVIMTGFTIKL